MSERTFVRRNFATFGLLIHNFLHICNMYVSLSFPNNNNFETFAIVDTDFLQVSM